MVGREGELSQLWQAYERTVRERTAYLFTVLGTAGIGKSRLVREFLGRVEGDATIAVGRCLSYGEGITYWPLAEALRGLGAPEAADLLGRVTARSGGAAEEIAYAARQLFERLARERPLVLVLDDLHWAESTFLDLVEYLADWSRDAPILVVAIARPDLLDARPTWAGGKLNATSILLESLSEWESERLIDALLARPRLTPEVRRRIVQAAEGNPLFVEQMLAMAGEDDTNGEVAVPPTIQALLAARLERLPAGERTTVELAAVVGKEFTLGEVRELSTPDERAVTADRVLALVRKELVRPWRVVEDAELYRFRHQLIRDAAYEAMSKEVRAALHERYADRLEQPSGERPSELDEIAGYHLEQAHRYRVELGALDEKSAGLGRRAAGRLAVAGQRALARGDLPAAETLLERAIALLGPEDPRVADLLCDLSIVLRDQGRFDEVDATLTRVLEQGRAAPAVMARAELLRTYVRTLKGGSQATALATTDRVIRLLEEEGAERELELAEAYTLLGIFSTWRGSMRAGQQAYERAAELAKRTGHGRVLALSYWWRLANALWGPTTVEEALELCRRIRNDTDSAVTNAAVANTEAAFLLMLERADAGALEQVARTRILLEELGQRVALESSRMVIAVAYLFTGELKGAEEELRPAREGLLRMGEKGFLSTVTALLALALCGQGRYDEADPFATESEEIGAPDDLTTQAAWRAARTQILAARGEADAAIAVGREGLAMVEHTDMTSDQITSLVGLGSAYATLGRREEAREAFEAAGDLLAKKGVVLGEPYIRRLVAEL